MNRTIVKTGAALAIVAGLMGGVPAVPAAYADAPAAEAQQVTKEQLQKLVDKVAAMQPFVTSESWAMSGVGNALTGAHLILTGEVKGSYEQALKNLEGAYGALKPGKNLTLFTDPKTDSILGENADNMGYGTSDLLRAYWLDSTTSTDPVADTSLFLKNAVNGKSVWRENGHSGTALIGREGKNAPVYIQLDLKKSESIATFTLWRDPKVKTGETPADPNDKDSRPKPIYSKSKYINTALVVSDDPGFNDKTVVYYSGDSDVFKLGVNPSDKYYEETPSGKDLMAGKSPVKGRYVRLYLNGTEADRGGANYVLEVAMSGADKVDSSQLYDTSELEGAIARVRALLRDHAGDYSVETVKALEESLAKAEDLLARIKNGTANENLGAVSDLVANIEKAEQNLVKAYTVTFDDKIDATENVAIEAAEGTAIALPANPVHPQGYAFEGWFLDKEGKTAFDPAAHTTGDITVYAKWSTPAAELKPAEPVKPEVKPENGKKPAKGGKLPQTGDASVFAVAASALGSAAAFAAARRRK